MTKLLPEIGDYYEGRGVCVKVDYAQVGQSSGKLHYVVDCMFAEAIPFKDLTPGNVYYCKKYGDVMFVRHGGADNLPAFAVVDEVGKITLKFFDHESQAAFPDLLLVHSGRKTIGPPARYGEGI